MTRQEVMPEFLSGSTAVVLDVFLATTTLLTILENGARRVFPVATVEAAEELRNELGDGVLRGGEQNAALVPGYDLGPLPEEYTPEVVSGRDVILVTTNGTRAIADAAPAGQVLLGCLRNAPAVARYVEESPAELVYLVCAGSSGIFNLDDLMGAATIISHLDLDKWSLNDAALAARDLARHHDGRLPDALAEGRAGRWFVENGRKDTFDFIGDVGASDLVPEVHDGSLRPAEMPSRKATERREAGQNRELRGAF